MSQPLTILHFSSTKSVYGGETQALLLARGLQQRGHRNIVLAREGGPVAARAAEWGLEVRGIPGNPRTPLNLLRVRRTVKTLHPDLVHAHDAHAVDVMGLSCLGLSPVRLATRRCNFSLKSPWKYRRACHRMIAISQAVLETTVASGFPRDRLIPIFSCVDADRIRKGNAVRGRNALGMSPDIPLLLQVGSLVDVKGHNDTLKALAPVLKQFPKLQVVFAGDGPLRMELEKLAQSLGVDSVVRFLGYRSDIPDLIAAADLFVMPSLSEALGTSVIDAMIAGKPIVTSTAGGIPELVGEWETAPAVARLIPPANPTALSQAILDLLSHPVAAAMLGQAAQIRAEANFTVDRLVEQTLSAYRQMLHSSRRNAA